MDNVAPAGDAPAHAGAQEIVAEDGHTAEPDQAPASANHTEIPAQTTSAPVATELASALDDLGLRSGDGLI